MLDVIKAASYIATRYNSAYGCDIDEMKLHKLLYFAQRESLIMLDEPLFATAFHAWKYGPVIIEIRTPYKQRMLNEKLSEEESAKYGEVFDRVFKEYASKDSWSLSSISHGELSWQKAREGIPTYENSNRLMSIEDIKEDAHRIKFRRFLLSKMQIVSSNA